jgi:minor extracellular serine protease Vpr
MKKLYTFMLAVSAALTVNAQVAKDVIPKLSPVTRMLLKDMAHTGNTSAIPDGYVYQKDGNGQLYLSGMIKVANAGMVTEPINQLGVKVGTKAGDIWTVRVPYASIKAFTEIKGISYIQLDEPLRPALATARKTTRADSVQLGIGLPYPFTGREVIMGVIDFGFDYGHPTFFDTLGTSYRINRVWELNTTGTPPTGYTYGHELTTPSTIQAQGTDNADQFHGTSTAGIAGGSGYGSVSNRSRGFSYDADFVLVGVRRDTIGDQWRQSSFSDFTDGVNYIFNYATAQSRPSVVNISWGSQSGPHDGTSLFSQACDNLSGAGKLISMSAGNEGEERIHLSKTFTPTDTAINTFVTFTPSTYKRTWVDVWGDTAKTFCGKVTLYKNGVAGATTGYICIDDQTHSTYILGANGLDTCFVDFITSSSEFNDKPRMTLNIWNKSDDSIHISLSGKSGSIDIWDEYYYYGYKYQYQSAFESLGIPGAVNGNTVSTVSDMGSARSVLLVGAYASKISFTDINGRSRSYAGYATRNDIVPFSSRGPMADGRIKPDITAPGLTLATSVSSFATDYTPTGASSNQVVSSYTFNGKTYYYAEFIGTSASSPVAAGILGLMLQANPRLTPLQANTIVAQTAIQDNFTGALPAAGNNDWGHGKINAYAAVKAALAANSVQSYTGIKPECTLYPNPNSGDFTIKYKGTRSETLTVSIFNVAGSLVSTSVWTVNKGENLKQLKLSNVAKGLYSVKIAGTDGYTTIKTLVD